MANLSTRLLARIGLIRREDGSRITPADLDATKHSAPEVSEVLTEQRAPELPPPTYVADSRPLRVGEWSPEDDRRMLDMIVEARPVDGFFKQFPGRTAKGCCQRVHRLVGRFPARQNPQSEAVRAAAYEWLKAHRDKNYSPLTGKRSKRVEPAPPQPAEPVVKKANYKKAGLKHWSAAEDRLATRLADEGKTCDEIRHELGTERTAKAVYQYLWTKHNRVVPLGVSWKDGKPTTRKPRAGGSVKRWSEAEDAILHHGLIEKMSIEDIAKALPGRTVRAIGQRVSTKYQDPKVRQLPMRQGSEWSDIEIDTIRKAKAEQTDLELAAKLHRSTQEVANKRLEVLGATRWHQVSEAVTPKVAPATNGDASGDDASAADPTGSPVQSLRGIHVVQ